MSTVTVLREYAYRNEGFGGTRDPLCFVCHKSMRKEYTVIVRHTRDSGGTMKQEIHGRCLDKFQRKAEKFGD